ncbi:MAG: short-chain dehydrogenase, partial [Deltaproteobacteria bacterium]
MEGKIVLITGSTDGIGKATALRLAQAGATVLLHGRSQEKLDGVLEEIRKLTGNNKIHAYRADFSSLEDVRHLIEILQHDLESLDVLINNAGVFMQRRVLTQDSLEMT